MKKLPLFLIIAVAVLSLGGYVLSQLPGYHDFEGRCLDCHITVPRPGDKPRAFKRDITAMCYACHENIRDLSHPVDIRPSMEVPRDLPLDWKGQVTCVTCHPAHKPGFGDARLRTSATGEGFCVNCHGDLEQEMHKVAIGTAHVAGTTGGKVVPWMAEETLDEMSLKCMACHDATFAMDSIVENKAFSFFHNNTGIGLSHPVGVSYVEAKRKYKGAYRDMDRIPKEIKLFSGIVGCGSCHNPYSKRHNELVMSNEGSKLCLACHVK